MESKYEALAKKIKALSDRGVGGEATNAKKLLDQYCRKHGISIESLEGDVTEMREFKALDKFHRKFIHQIISSVLGSKMEAYSKARSKSVFVKLTHFDFIEIQAKIDFYYKVWEGELNSFWIAFIHLQKIYSKPDDNENDDSEKTPPKELNKILHYMSGIKKVEYHKQLD